MLWLVGAVVTVLVAAFALLAHTVRRESERVGEAIVTSKVEADAVKVQEVVAKAVAEAPQTKDATSARLRRRNF